jgi:hypothetical protein
MGQYRLPKSIVVACLLITDGAGRVRQAIRSFGTWTTELLALVDWLAEAGCTHVAMESTGVYWKPVYNLLEGQFEVLVVNAHHLKGLCCISNRAAFPVSYGFDKFGTENPHD